jgi:hypothetical protein
VSRALIAQLGDDSTDPSSWDALSLAEVCNHRSSRQKPGLDTRCTSAVDWMCVLVLYVRS